MIMVVLCYHILSQVMVAILLAAFEQVFSVPITTIGSTQWNDI
jgi:hypothetical protein